MPLKIMESSAENDLPLVNNENALGVVNGSVALEASLDANNCTKQLMKEDKTVPIKHSQFKCNESCGRIDRGKALLHGDVNETFSKKWDDSHESAESCNSVGSSIKGKKRKNFEQKLIVDSKIVKRRAEDSPPPSFVRQESSFMNWISNMLKGLSGSDHDGTPSLALTLTHPNFGDGSKEKKLVMRVADQDSDCKMGFQAIFRSLYGSKRILQDKIKLDEKYPAEERSESFVLDKKASSIVNVPRTCHEKSKKFWENNVFSNEISNHFVSGHGAGSSTQALKPTTSVPLLQENCDTICGNISSLQCGDRVDQVSSSNSSRGKRKTDSSESKEFVPPLKKKAISSVAYGSVYHASLWITRFASKTSNSVMNLDHCNHTASGLIENSTNCTRSHHLLQNHIGSSKDHKNLEVHDCSSKDLWNDKEIPDCSAKKPEDRKLITDMNPNVSSLANPIFEALASVFSRTLDTLKHIIQSDKTDNMPSAAGICFFCGKQGHDLPDCSLITETELEDLLRNINAYNGAEEPLRLCIRCFQHNHWAISCPSAVSRRHSQLEVGTSFVNNCSSATEKESRKKLMESEERLIASHEDVFCRTINPWVDTNFHLNQKTTGVMIPDKLIPNLNKGIDVTSSCGRTTSLRNSEVTTAIFDAVKKIRLSRSDILKWMNSHEDLSLLDGFFLRLRAGKGQERQGEAGYYVGCLGGIGAQRESTRQGSGKDQISLSVGGINCLVESHYISNHDFLEGELMAWWKATLRCGGKIPSEEHLRTKLEQRKKLWL